MSATPKILLNKVFEDIHRQIDIISTQETKILFNWQKKEKILDALTQLDIGMVKLKTIIRDFDLGHDQPTGETPANLQWKYNILRDSILGVDMMSSSQNRMLSVLSDYHNQALREIQNLKR